MFFPREGLAGGAEHRDFFVNLIDMGTVWEPVDESEERFVGKNREVDRDPR